MQVFFLAALSRRVKEPDRSGRGRKQGLHKVTANERPPRYAVLPAMNRLGRINHGHSEEGTEPAVDLSSRHDLPNTWLHLQRAPLDDRPRSGRSARPLSGASPCCAARSLRHDHLEDPIEWLRASVSAHPNLEGIAAQPTLALYVEVVRARYESKTILANLPLKQRPDSH